MDSSQICKCVRLSRGIHVGCCPSPASPCTRPISATLDTGFALDKTFLVSCGRRFSLKLICLLVGLLYVMGTVSGRRAARIL